MGGRSPRLAPGERVYAIGDIHGQRDLLIDLETRIADDLARRPPTGRVSVVYLGDYVDRGPDSRGVIDTLANLPPGGVERVFLLGNHDFWLREFTGGGLVRAWLQSGGDATLLSYGITSLPRLDERASIETVRRQLLRRMPPGHIRFLRNLLPMHRQGDYLFVHAGIRPGVSLEMQEQQDLVLMREPFLSDESDLGVVVVHGHTIVIEPELRVNRLCIDTGAYWTGRLTAAVLEAESVRFIDTRQRI